MGAGALPPGHPQLVGTVGFWGSPVANRLAAQADVILAVGTRFPETDSSSWQEGVTFRIPPTKLIHFDIDPTELGRNYPAHIASVTDAGSAIRKVTAALQDIPVGADRYDWAALRRERDEFLADAVEQRPLRRLPTAP